MPFIKYLVSAVSILCIMEAPLTSAEQKNPEQEDYRYSMKSELFEWGVYTGLYAGGLALELSKPLSSKPLIGGETGKPYKEKERVPSWWLVAWSAGTFGYIALTPNEEGEYSRVTYNNIKGLYESLSYSFFITEFTKSVAGRKRPSYDNYPESEKDNDGRKSFISGHSSISFTVATYSALYIGAHSGSNSNSAVIAAKSGAAILLFSAATYTAWSRIDDNRHNLSDTIAGASVGVASAVAGYAHQNGWFSLKTDGADISLVPYITDEECGLSFVQQF